MCLSWFATALSYFGYIQSKCIDTNKSINDEMNETHNKNKKNKI